MEFSSEICIFKKLISPNTVTHCARVARAKQQERINFAKQMCEQSCWRTKQSSYIYTHYLYSFYFSYSQPGITKFYNTWGGCIIKSYNTPPPCIIKFHYALIFFILSPPSTPVSLPRSRQKHTLRSKYSHFSKVFTWYIRFFFKKSTKTSLKLKTN